MAKERIQVAVPKKADENLAKISDKLDITKGKVVELAVEEFAKKVL